MVLLIGTNDIEEQAEPETIAGNLQLILAAFQQPFVHHIEHFKEAHVLVDAPGGIGLKMAGVAGVGLSPDPESEIQCFAHGGPYL